MRVLLAEHHTGVADDVARRLRRAGLAVDRAADGDRALRSARMHGHDVVVLDRELPGLPADEILRVLAREQPETRLLVVGDGNELEDVVPALESGADDYVAKPARPAELVARVRALGRRSRPAVPPVLVHGDLVVDPARRIATRRGRDLGLVNKELAVLEALLAADGAVLSADDLLREVWDENADPWTNVVRQTIMTLRRKLGDPPVVETVIGAGYRIRPVAAREAEDLRGPAAGREPVAA